MVSGDEHLCENEIYNMNSAAVIFNLHLLNTHVYKLLCIIHHQAVSLYLTV